MRPYKGYHWNTTGLDNFASPLLTIDQGEYANNRTASCLYCGNSFECRTSGRNYILDHNDAITCFKRPLNQLPGSVCLCFFSNGESTERMFCKPTRIANGV